MTQQSNSQNQKTSESGIRRRKRHKKISDALKIAIIGSVVTFAGVVFGFPPFSRWVDAQLFPSLTPTSVIFMPSDTPTFTAIPSATFTNMPFTTFTPVPSETFMPSPMPTETPIPPQMMIVLRANKYGGETPLNVQFSAEGSYVQSADGTKSYCTHSTCTYTWTVAYTNDQRIVATPRAWQETFAYNFSRRGLYYVKVTVCQGSICGSSNIQVEGR